MRFTRYLSDGNSVIQERIRLPLQPLQPELLVETDAPIQTRDFDDGGRAGAAYASRDRVLAGIDELLRSIAATA